MGKIVVGILAHVDAGKTTLSEGMLYTSGAIRTMGRVDNRDAFLDTYALERERGITIFSKQAVFPLGTTQVALLDSTSILAFPEVSLYVIFVYTKRCLRSPIHLTYQILTIHLPEYILSIESNEIWIKPLYFIVILPYFFFLCNKCSFK